jgi:hypothetical protein
MMCQETQAILNLSSKIKSLLALLLSLASYTFLQLFSLLSFPKSHVGVPLIPLKVLCSSFLLFG